MLRTLAPRGLTLVFYDLASTQRIQRVTLVGAACNVLTGALASLIAGTSTGRAIFAALE